MLFLLCCFLFKGGIVLGLGIICGCLLWPAPNSLKHDKLKEMESDEAGKTGDDDTEDKTNNLEEQISSRTCLGFKDYVTL